MYTLFVSLDRYRLLFTGVKQNSRKVEPLFIGELTKVVLLIDYNADLVRINVIQYGCNKRYKVDINCECAIFGITVIYAFI